jgi:hypothetical protein
MKFDLKLHIEKKGEKHKAITRLRNIIKELKENKEDIFPYGIESSYTEIKESEE